MLNIKFLSLLILLIGSYSCQFLNFLEDIEPDSIELYKASSNQMIKNGITQVNNRFYIRTSTNLTDKYKYVSIHQEMQDGDWKDFPAQIVQIFQEDGKTYQMWKAEVQWISMEQVPYDYGSKFVLKLQTSHCQLWDNNQKNFYEMELHSGPMLGRNVNISLDAAHFDRCKISSNRFYGTVLVKNLAEHKEVYVVYSTDKWKTSKKIMARSAHFHTVPYSQQVVSPNSHNVEAWEFSEEISGNQIEVKAGVDMNGDTYWDNNFGVNYQIIVEEH